MLIEKNVIPAKALFQNLPFPCCCKPFLEKRNAFHNHTAAHAIMVGLRHKLPSPSHSQTQRFPCCCNTFTEKVNAFCNRTEAHARMVGFRHKLLKPTHFHYPPFLCCCKPLHKKRFAALHSGFILTVCRFFPLPTCHAQTGLRQCSFAPKRSKQHFKTLSSMPFLYPNGLGYPILKPFLFPAIAIGGIFCRFFVVIVYFEQYACI